MRCGEWQAVVRAQTTGKGTLLLDFGGRRYAVQRAATSSEVYVEVEGVARDVVSRCGDQNGNQDLAGEGGGFKIRFKGEFVADRPNGAVEAVGVGFAVVGEKFCIGHGASVGSDSMTALLPPSDRSLDVLCVGNAIVDVLAQTDDSFLEDHGMVKGSMQLTDPDRARTIYAAMPPAVEISGGSAANTAAGLASLGTSVAFIGKVADDVQRLVEMWSALLQEHGGPLLFGRFCIADAYFAPVCMRLKTYGLPVPPDIAAYILQVCALPGVKAWVESATAEQDFRDFEEPYRVHR
jgi:glutathione S-transferase